MKQSVMAMILMLSIAAMPLQAADIPDFGDISQQGLSTQQEREIGENAMRQFAAAAQLLKIQKLFLI